MENQPSSTKSSTQNEETDLHGEPNLVTTDQARVGHQSDDLHNLPSDQSSVYAMPSASHHQMIPQIAPGAGNYLVQSNPMLGLHSHSFTSTVDPSLPPAVPFYSSNAPQQPISGPNFMGIFPPILGTEYFAHQPTGSGMALPPAASWPGTQPGFGLEIFQPFNHPLPPHQGTEIFHQGGTGSYLQQMGNPLLQIAPRFQGSHILNALWRGSESQIGQQGGIYPGLYADFTHSPAAQDNIIMMPNTPPFVQPPALPSDSDELKMPSVASEKNRINPYLNLTNYTETKDPGFCVLCERQVAQIYNHKKWSHSTSGLYAYSIFSSCPEPKTICAPAGVEAGNEVSQCQTCKGIFYNHRVDKRNHNCIAFPDVKSIDQGNGSEYCLLCQLQCENVEQHWQQVHKSNKSYQIGQLFETKIKTLYPLNIAREELIYEFCSSDNESCETCDLLTFKTRLRRMCAGSRI
ncbi:Hypothetical predicted protein [Cloeon dipterum]|uniref:Uncharacterized protein n=1 Tax=Cloeon dipterum TaxID=197152 RepID=A0A8S1E094_9INSE|nr:Hypothetical predicted protein [Cloeon dipterum]